MVFAVCLPSLLSPNGGFMVSYVSSVSFVSCVSFVSFVSHLPETICRKPLACRPHELQIPAGVSVHIQMFARCVLRNIGKS